MSSEPSNEGVCSIGRKREQSRGVSKSVKQFIKRRKFQFQKIKCNAKVVTSEQPFAQMDAFGLN